MSKESSHPTQLSADDSRPARGRHRAPRRPSPPRRALALAMAAGLAGMTPLIVGTSPAHADVNWDAVAQCESGGNWHINTLNGYSGGLQFSSSTWRAHGGQQFAGSAHRASRTQQITVARRVLRSQGIGAWPTCGGLGARKSSPNRWSSKASRSNSRQSHRHRYSSTERNTEHTGSRSYTYKSTRSGGTRTWRSGSESTENRSYHSRATRHQKRTATPAHRRATALPVRPVAVADFVGRRQFTLAQRPAPATPTLLSYQVRAGDSLILIAADNHVSWQTLYARNRATIGANPNIIQPGQRIVVG